MDFSIALEVNVEALLAQEPLTSNDCAEIRREVLRSEESHSSFQKLLDKRYPAESEDPEIRWRRGVGLIVAGKDGNAAELMAAAQKPLGLFLLGRSALEKEEHPEALEYLKQVSGQDQPAEYRVAYAEALARLNDVEGLAGMLGEFQELDPRGADCAFLEGRLTEMQGEYGRAIEAYERAISIQPDHRNARFRLAHRLDLTGKDEEAIGHYERLRQIFPVSVGVLINLGILYEDCEKYEKAVSCFKLALAHDPTQERAASYLRDAESALDMFYDEEKERKDDKQAQILKIPVTDFELSVRSRNCLARMNILTLGDLIRKSEAELLSFKNFGETSLNEIKEILRSKGLRLGTQPDDGDRRSSASMGRRHRELDRDSVRSKLVSELDLSVRSRKALDDLNVATLGQLAEVSEDQLMACKNFGQTSLVEIKKKLLDNGLTLRGG
ncbi:MAG: DNA-directed RNA polymerase subunit alpha C-terminal domain-containing protein [Planctomycetota bacterium]